MNYLVLTLAVFAGLVISALLWWRYKNTLGSVATFLAIVGMVALALPWNVERVAGNLGSGNTNQRASREDASVRKAMFTMAELEPYRPAEVPSHGYVGSDACQECHVDNHASWKASYHRTMTQVAKPEVILGNFDNVRVRHGNRDYFLTRNEETCMVDMPDLTVPDNSAERVRAPIVMTTGSHHMQVYWFATGFGRGVAALPLVHLNETQEWIPSSASFLRHFSLQSFETGRWNNVCSNCHSTHRKQRVPKSGPWDTHVSELGISCEACHGPGQKHIDFRRQVDARSSASLETLVREDPIVNPEKLSKVQSAQVCGQCHSVITVQDSESDEYNINGHSYRPGDDLLETHVIWHRDTPEHLDMLQSRGYGDLESMLLQTYYRDGMIRVAGREYNGLIHSSCYQNGEMTCLSCHQLHKSDSDARSLKEWADDQLRPNAVGDAACTQCHQAGQYSTRHTHHAVGSAGAACYNCHMPHTVYGLLKGIRSHTISSPEIANDNGAKRPNACNLCHLDKTLQWSAQRLNQWYGIEPPELDKDQREVAASLLWLLKGDAAQRALTAWAMGWDEAQQASGNDWQTPFLAALLDDRYEAIRLIARRSLQTLPGLSDFRFDVVTSSSRSDRLQVVQRILNSWSHVSAESRTDRPELLIKKSEGLQVDRIDRLLEHRDQTRMSLTE